MGGSYGMNISLILSMSTVYYKLKIFVVTSMIQDQWLQVIHVCMWECECVCKNVTLYDWFMGTFCIYTTFFRKLMNTVAIHILWQMEVI